jgi:putative ABC transport system permease protein
MNDLTLIRKNLLRKKLRAFLLVFAIFIAFLIYGVLGAVEHAFTGDTAKVADNRLVTVNKINFTQTLPISYVERIRAVEGVQAVSYANWFGGYYQETKNQVFTFAVEPASWLATHPEYVLPDDQRKAWTTNRTGILVGRKAAEKWGWKLGDTIPLSSNIYTNKSTGTPVWNFTIVGIFDANDPTIDTNRALFDHANFDESVTFGRDTAGLIILNTTNPTLNDQVIKTIDQMFANSPAETSTDTAQAFNKAFAAQLGNIALIVTLVVGAAFATILMIVGNTMVMAIRERTREIGVLKSLGFAGPRILKLVLGESVLLAVVGGLLGLGSAALVVRVLGKVGGDFVRDLAMTPDIVIKSIIYMVLLGLVTGALPALNATRLNISNALGRS